MKHNKKQSKKPAKAQHEKHLSAYKQENQSHQSNRNKEGSVPDDSK